MDAHELAAVGAALLGAELRAARRLSGGDLSSVVRIELADGRVAAAKNGPAPLAEAAMLQTMAKAGVPVPAVLGVNDRALVLSWVEGGDPLAPAWGDMGAVAARLHAVVGPRYGWNEDYAFGAVRIDNRWCDRWPQFWAERRLLPQLPQLPAAVSHRLEKLAADLQNRLPARPGPVLLHGDLWSGNVMARGDRVAALIDPACYYGHAEVDLAMLQLFDASGPDFHRHYGPSEPDAQARLAIYQLWPALVHLRLFGSGYLALVESRLAAAGV
jgi:fructosamine-3-kinase